MIRLAEDAAKLPHCDMAYNWSLGPNLLFPEFAILRQFARIFRVRALLATDAIVAWDDIARTAKLGNLIGETPCLIAALVAVAIQAIADKGYIETLKRFGPSAKAHETLTAFAPPPTPSHYLKGEVIMATATMELLREGKLKNINGDEEGVDNPSVWQNLSVVAPIATAFWEKQLLVFWRGAFAQVRLAERTGNYEELSKWFDATVHTWERDRLNTPQNLMVLILTPVFSQATNKTHLQTAALRQLRETALALSEEKAKTGSFPDSPTLPTDPFSPDKQPLRYKKDGDGCVLYSVGQDHTDDGGVEMREKNSEKLDLVVRL